MKAMKFLYILFALCIFTSCEKDEDKTEDSPIVGTWQVVNYERKTGVNGAWAPVSDLSCRLQEKQTYSADGQFSQTSGACAGANTGISGTWKLSSNQSTVTYTYTKYTGEFPRTIEKLNASDLVISWDSGSTTGTYFRVTYRKSN